VATHRAESWTLNTDIAKRLATFIQKLEEECFEEIKVNENRRKRYNTELMQLFRDFHIL
jgi:hypothetical protein